MNPTTPHSKRDLHLVRRPGSPQARRDKLRETMPVLEQAHDNGWRWSEILEMARELLNEPQMSLRALINLRYRYKRLLARRPDLNTPIPAPPPVAQPLSVAPIAPPVDANAAEAPVQSPGESAIARARRLQQQDKTSAALAAPHSLSGKAPRTVARKIEEIAQALEADSDMLKYPMMGAEEAMALAQDLKARNGLNRAMMEFAHYCVDRILPVYQDAPRPLIEMRTQFEQWKEALLEFSRRRRPYKDILLLAVQQISPFPNLDEYSGPFEQFTLTQVRSAISERLKKEAESREKRETT